MPEHRLSSLNTRVKRVSGKSGKSVSIIFERDGVEKTLTGTHLLVAAGRIPNTQGIGLDVAGVELTNRGYVKVNERLETTAPGVWAVGMVAKQEKVIELQQGKVIGQSCRDQDETRKYSSAWGLVWNDGSRQIGHGGGSVGAGRTPIWIQVDCRRRTITCGAYANARL